MLKKIFSYIYPITIYKTNSTISGDLKIVLYNGELLLNTKNTNYSFGSLQLVLDKALRKIGIKNITNFQRIALLGIGGGCVVNLLQENFNFKNIIDGVEIDPNIIAIGEQFFNWKTKENFNYQCDDAFKWIKNTTYFYDLIIIDIFKDIEMPKNLFDKTFHLDIQNKLNKNGYVIFNMMLLEQNKNNIINQVLAFYSSEEYIFEHLKKVEHYNDVLIIQKK